MIETLFSILFVVTLVLHLCFFLNNMPPVWDFEKIRQQRKWARAFPATKPSDDSVWKFLKEE